MARRKLDFDPLETPNYTVDEAARYLHVTDNTIRYWTVGERGAAPLSTVYCRRPLLLSFKNVVECYVLESLRNIHDVSVSRIRRSVEELRREKPSKYPLADYQLSTVGRSIYLDHHDELVSLLHGGQNAFRAILAPFLKRVERNAAGIARRLFPFTRREHLQSPQNAPRYVVIDPSVSFGMPVLTDSRISTAFLLSRKKGGASLSTLAADYGRSEEEIDEAIAFEASQTIQGVHPLSLS